EQCGTVLPCIRLRSSPMPTSSHEPSIWELASPSRGQYPPLPGDVETDVCVVGAGITGLTTALLLKQAGRRVILVEKDHLGAGTTGGTSAHLTNVVDFRYNSLAQSYGFANARRVAESMTFAINLRSEERRVGKERRHRGVA